MRHASNSLKTLTVCGLIIAAGSCTAAAQKQYDIGVSDTEIKIGNVMPYSGPASAYAAIGKTEATHEGQIRFAVEHALDLPAERGLHRHDARLPASPTEVSSWRRAAWWDPPGAR